MNIKKVVLYFLLFIFAAVGCIFAYTLLTTSKHSPKDTVSYSKNDFSISVDYSRPYKKGRLIFGTEQSGALQPFGKYWRTGANDATEIEINQDVVFVDQTLEAGRYVLYTIPDSGQWTIGLNSAVGRWGAWEVDYSKDVLQTHVKPMSTDTVTEQMTIDFTELSQGVSLNIKWDHVYVPIAIKPYK